MILRDKCWLWCHPEAYYNNCLPEGEASRMTPMEACLFLGVRNAFMIPLDRKLNLRQYNKSFTTLRGVGWDCFNSQDPGGDVEEIIRQAADFPNVRLAVMDDFQRINAETSISPDFLWNLRRRLHENEVRPLELWMVFYTHEFGIDPEKDAAFTEFIAPFDGVMMWPWNDTHIAEVPEKFEIFKKLTPGKKRMVGCYLWNFSEGRQAEASVARAHLDWCRGRLLAGEIDGICLHSNSMADLDYEAFDMARSWMFEHGDELIPDYPAK